MKGRRYVGEQVQIKRKRSVRYFMLRPQIYYHYDVMWIFWESGVGGKGKGPRRRRNMSMKAQSSLSEIERKDAIESHRIAWKKRRKKEPHDNVLHTCRSLIKNQNFGGETLVTLVPALDIVSPCFKYGIVGTPTGVPLPLWNGVPALDLAMISLAISAPYWSASCLHSKTEGISNSHHNEPKVNG